MSCNLRRNITLRSVFLFSICQRNPRSTLSVETYSNRPPLGTERNENSQLRHQRKLTQTTDTQSRTAKNLTMSAQVRENPLNPIMLQAQNIDLRQRLEEADARIRQLQILATQQTIHVVNEHSSSLNNNSEALEALRRASKTSPEKQLMDNLRDRCAQADEKLHASMSIVESLRAENEQLRSDLAAAAAVVSAESTFSPQHSISGDLAPPSSAPPESGASVATNSAALAQLESEKAALEKAMAGLRTQLATCNADVFRWKSAHTALNNELGKMRAETQRLQSENRDAMTAAAGASSSQAHIGQIKAINEELSDRLQSKSDELDAARAELARAQQDLLDQQKKAASAAASNSSSSSKNNSKLEAELAKVAADLCDEQATNRSLEAETAALRSQIRAMEQDHEKSRREQAEKEFDRILEGTDEEGRLRKRVRELEEAQPLLEAEAEKARAERGIMQKLKDKTLVQLNQTSEELQKSREHFQRREQELLAQIVALQQQGSQQQQIAQAQVQKAAAAASTKAALDEAAKQKQLAENVAQQQRLHTDRNAQEAARRKAELMAQLQAKTREDKATAEVIFVKVAAAYDKLLQNLREASKGQEMCHYELLWDYEGRLFHLRNDLESMKTIVAIKEQDAQGEMRRAKENLENQLTILRFQLQDLGAKPQC